MTDDELASLPSTIWPREDMKESPWETERTGVEWALSRRDSKPDNTQQRKAVHNLEVLLQDTLTYRNSDMTFSHLEENKSCNKKQYILKHHNKHHPYYEFNSNISLFVR